MLFLQKDDKNVLLSTVTSSGKVTLVGHLTSTLVSGNSNNNTVQCLTGMYPTIKRFLFVQGCILQKLFLVWKWHVCDE